MELKQFISNKSLAFFLSYCSAINVLCLTRKNYCYENARRFISIFFSVFYLFCIISHLSQIFVLLFFYCRQFYDFAINTKIVIIVLMASYCYGFYSYADEIELIDYHFFFLHNADFPAERISIVIIKIIIFSSVAFCGLLRICHSKT